MAGWLSRLMDTQSVKVSGLLPAGASAGACADTALPHNNNREVEIAQRARPAARARARVRRPMDVPHAKLAIPWPTRPVGGLPVGRVAWWSLSKNRPLPSEADREMG